MCVCALYDRTLQGLHGALQRFLPGHSDDTTETAATGDRKACLATDSLPSEKPQNSVVVGGGNHINKLGKKKEEYSLQKYFLCSCDMSVYILLRLYYKHEASNAIPAIAHHYLFTVLSKAVYSPSVLEEQYPWSNKGFSFLYSKAWHCITDFFF